MKLAQRRVIGLLTILGSAWGCWAGMELLNGTNKQALWALVFIWMSLFLWGLWCGINLIRHKTGRLIPVLAFWIFQVPFVYTPFIRFSFSAGPVAIVAYHPDQSKFDLFLFLGSRLELAVMAPSSGFIIGINFYAAIMVCLLSMQSEQ